MKFLAILALIVPLAASAQMHDMSHMQHGQSDPAGDLLMRQVSGTGMNPSAAAPHMTMTSYGGWILMLHGLAFVSAVDESGPRGENKLFSTNWLMGMADRPLAGGHLMLRSMLSLEPLTVRTYYPELFQTGETIHGRPIVDGQHPHDFFMELAAEYAHSIGADTVGYVYAAPFGDPALGPVAYPHRASAAEIPQAALSHHVQDSTHIAGSVITAGAQRGMLGVAVSGFHGREPDENRWDIDTGRIDSWSTRVTFDPTPNWSAQISTGHLHHPEASEPGDVQRTTASVSFSDNDLNTSVVFGHNDRSEGRSVSSLLGEATVRFRNRNYVTGRAEIVDKDELSVAGVHRIKALTLGYSRDIFDMNSVSVAVGANVTGYSIPDALKSAYGDPRSIYLFLRLRGH